MSTDPKQKQTYHKPNLKKYGSISEITMGPGMVGGDKDSQSSL
jgi:hypothetical protein